MHTFSLSDAVTTSATSVMWSLLPFLVAVGLFVIIVNVLQRKLEERLKRREIEARGPLDEKLTRIVELSSELTSLNGEVKAEFDLQLASTKKAQQDAKDAEAIAALNAEERRAAQAMVESAMDLALSKSGKRDRAFQFWLALGSFIAGVVVTIVSPLVFQWLA